VKLRFNKKVVEGNASAENYEKENPGEVELMVEATNGDAANLMA